MDAAVLNPTFTVMKKLLIGAGLIFAVQQLSAATYRSQNNTLPSTTSPNLNSPTAARVVRRCDPKGCGHYGASRGSRLHKGVDFTASPGEPIYSPINGTVERYPDPYGDGRYSGIQIVGAGRHVGKTVKMFYLTPSVAIGQPVAQGQRVGNCQNISSRYSPGMTNHVHVELIIGGEKVDVLRYMG